MRELDEACDELEREKYSMKEVYFYLTDERKYLNTDDDDYKRA